jgi:excinuclease ABC subunit C
MSEHSKLEEQARQTSSSAGVYCMKDRKGVILYVGKAKNLRNRIQTYFQQNHERVHTEFLMRQVASFEVILTETEAEALILEATLIKKYKPKFNVRLKDDKTYPYLKIDLGDRFPRLQWTRRVEKDQARYFGPFPSRWSSKQVMSLLIQTFQLRDCSDNVFAYRSRPCLLYQMQKCSGPCVDLISSEEYRQSVNEVVAILEGRSDFAQKLEQKMEKAAQEESYELAAMYRDQLKYLRETLQMQAVSDPQDRKNREVFHLAQQEGEAQAVILSIQEGALVSLKHYRIQNVDSSQTPSELLFQVIAQHYHEFYQTKTKIPRELLIAEPLEESTLLEQTFGLKILEPQSPLDHRLLQVALSNAQHALREGKQAGFSALEEVRKVLHLKNLPSRIECYDISHFHGSQAVGSRVVFLDGKPEKSLYRRYKIQTVVGNDDFAMMKEVLARRFSKEEDLPDLLVVDGGKGQLAQATAILQELHLDGVEAVGLAKSRVVSDFTSDQVDRSSERVFLPKRKNPILLRSTTQSYRVLTHLRDEAHRFAIGYHRLLRSKEALEPEVV